MAKLSAAQIKAIEYVWSYENELNPEVRPNTWASLVKAGLITRGAEVKVTTDGQTAYFASTGRELPLRYKSVNEHKTQADRAPGNPYTGPTKGRMVVNPVPTKIGSMNPGPTFVERPNTVHGGHTVAQVDGLIEGYQKRGLTDDEISARLDEWHLKANRADRRSQGHARKVANRLDMRKAPKKF